MGRVLRLSLLLVLGVALCAGRAGAWSARGGEDGGLVEVESLKSVAARREAAEELTAEAARLRGAGERDSLARALNRLAEIRLKLIDREAALAAASEAVALSRQSADPTLLADSLTTCAVVRRSLEVEDEYRAALRLLEEARELSARVGYRRGEARSLTELGTTYFEQDDTKRAAACGEEALRIWRELQDRRGEARVLYNLGAPYMRLGRTAEGRDALQTSAALWREMGDATEEASTLIELNFLAIRGGEWGEALALLNRIEPLVPDKEAEPFIAGQIATSFGEVYEAYGQLESARNYFYEAATLYRDHARDGTAAADAVRKAGRVLARLGDYEGAVRRIDEGLRLATEHDDVQMVALCHEDLGRVHLSAGLYAQARAEMLRAVEGYERIDDRRSWARAQTFLGQTYDALGDPAAASESYESALRVFTDKGDQTNEAAVRFGLGRLELGRGNLEAAGEQLSKSIALTEQLREHAPSKDLRSSFLASVHDRYETYVEWLMRQHAARPGERFDVRAFEASEMGRARSLLDSLGAQQRELRQAADPALLAEKEALQKEELRLLDRRAAIQVARDAGELSKVEAEMSQLRARQETLQARINGSKRLDELLRPAPLGFDEIRSQTTDADTSLLEFSLGERESYLWLVTPEGLESHTLPGKQTIQRAALRLADLFAARRGASAREAEAYDAEVEAAAAELSRVVLGPVAGRLRTQRLVVVPDGVLQYVPFQILKDPREGGEPLIARHEIVNAPSASTLVAARREAAGRGAAPKLLAAFGDPVFQSNYSLVAAAKTRGGDAASPPDGGGPQRALASELADALEPDRVQPLMFAKRELNVLRRLAPSDEALIYSEFDATRERLRGLDLRQYRVLHFATHGLLDARQPERSGLLLSLVDRDGRPVSGFVGLSDIYKLRAPVDLVVLSACRTALGEEVRGEGLVGLTRGFMYAGASSVVASLWKVDDEATAELMRRFYSNMLERGLTPSAALRDAQNSIRREPQWRSPYYWAAFTLQGEYRQVIRPAGAGPLGTKALVSGASALTLLALAAWWYVRRRAGRRAPRAEGYSTMKR